VVFVGGFGDACLFGCHFDGSVGVGRSIWLVVLLTLGRGHQRRIIISPLTTSVNDRQKEKMRCGCHWLGLVPPRRPALGLEGRSLGAGDYCMGK
jgi:hypothetical protein